MKRFGHRDRSMSTDGLIYLGIGAVVGVAAGMFLAQKYGGFRAIASRIPTKKPRTHAANGTDQHTQRHRMEREHLEGYDAHDYTYDHEPWEHLDATDEALSATEELEERVLEAYRNDPILSERAIDIGALDVGIIELTGWVHSPSESKHAVTLARGTPGVETVLNRLAVREEEEWFGQHAARYKSGDASLSQGQWETPSAPREAPPAPRAD